MIKKTIIFLSLILFLIKNFKKKDFILNGEYEDITIVYALLNPDDTLHYIKVYKSFLSEGNIYDAAKDINNYSYIDSIEVKMEEYNGNQLIQTIYFDTTTNIPKDSGIFAYPLQVLYTCHAKLNRDYTYKLIVRNLYTQKTTIATSEMVGTVGVKYPVYYPGKINHITFLPRKQQIELVKGKNIAVCQAAYHFYYTEVNYKGERRQQKPVIWKVGESKSNYISYVGETLLKKIKDEVKENKDVDYRLTDSIVLHVYTEAHDLYLYLLSISASTGLNQERLEYTNMKSYHYKDNQLVEDNNALGVFSSRGHFSLMFDEFSKNTNDSLVNGRYTRHLKFKKYDY